MASLSSLNLSWINEILMQACCVTVHTMKHRFFSEVSMLMTILWNSQESPDLGLLK